MAAPYTARQGQYLSFIHGYIVRQGYAPSFEDIARHFGTSTPSVNGMIKTLESRGLLERIPGVARSLRVCVPAADLPESDFGQRRKPSPATERPDTRPRGPAASDAAATAAIAVLDTMMRLAQSEPEFSGVRIVMESAKAVQAALLKLGVPEDDALGAGRRVAAEAARYTESGQGIVVRTPPLWWRRLTGQR
jgi:hypothetical protein